MFPVMAVVVMMVVMVVMLYKKLGHLNSWVL